MFIDDKNCPLCKTSSHFLIIKDSFQHFKCTDVNCALIFVYPPPSNLDDVYKFNLDFDAHDSNVLIESPKVKSTLNISIARRLITERCLSKVLDVGCGSGNFILGIQDLVSDVLGVEPNKHAASHCKRLGLNVRNEFFSAVNLKKGDFDLINIADVIEHVADPRSLIKDAIDLMSERGILIIRTPNLDSLWSKQTYLLSKWLGIPWSSLTPPEHLSNFSLIGLSNLLNEEKLKIESIMNEPPSLMYELGQLHLRKDLVRMPSFRRLVKLFLGYSSYTIVYLLNQIMRPFLKTNFSQTIIAKK